MWLYNSLNTPYLRNSRSTYTDWIHQTQPFLQSLHSRVIISIPAATSSALSVDDNDVVGEADDEAVGEAADEADPEGELVQLTFAMK